MLSRYPTSGQASGRRGLATYTEMLSTPLARILRLTVIAEKLPPGVEGAEIAEEGPAVQRLWTEGRVGLLPVIRQALSGGRTVDIFHLQHEFLGYGNLVSNALLLAVLFLFRLRGSKTVVTLHGVLTRGNIPRLRFGDYGYSMPSGRLHWVLHWWTRTVAGLSNAIIVHEHWQREALVHEYGINPELVHRIPHGVRDLAPVMPVAKPAVSGKLTLLFFGYLAPYKGLETLLDAVTELPGTDIELLIAGDVSPRARGNLEYSAYLKDLDARIAATGGRARRLGFIPEGEVENLFRSVDLVVLPYSSVLSASGPLALAAAFGTPVLATREIFEEATASTYDGTEEDLRRKLVQFSSSPELRERAIAEVTTLGKDRTWPNIAARHAALYEQIRNRAKKANKTSTVQGRSGSS